MGNLTRLERNKIEVKLCKAMNNCKKYWPLRMNIKRNVNKRRKHREALAKLHKDNDERRKKLKQQITLSTWKIKISKKKLCKLFQHCGPMGESDNGSSGASGTEEQEEGSSGASGAEEEQEEGSSGASGAEDEEGEGSSGASGAENEEGSSGASGAEDEEEGSSGASGAEDEEGSSGASGAEDEEEGSSGASGPNGDTVTTGESEAEEAKRCNEGIGKSEKKFCKLHKESKKTCESGGRGRCVWHKKSCKPRCPPKQLLYRCRVDGATPDGCCNFKPPYDHPLYRKSNVYQGIVEKKASSDLVCCNRDIGMWMPTHLKHESDKFCTSDLNEKRSEEDINAVADAASKFKAALGSLQEIKDAAVQDFREQYRTNEATEALGDDKNAKLRVQVDTERQSVEGQQTQVELNK